MIDEVDFSMRNIESGNGTSADNATVRAGIKEAGDGEIKEIVQDD